MMTLRVVELFAGIGAQASALERLGIDFTSTVCEWDDKAYRAYCAIHGYAPNLGDITKVEHLPECDLLTYSFPCQDLSIAGNRKGMKEGSGTRSALLWEVERLLQDMKDRGCLPEVLLMENVDAILYKENRPYFEKFIIRLNELGYDSSYAVLNAKDFGIPQNRNRCFMVSTLHKGAFRFPTGFPLTLRLKDMLEDNVPESYYLSKERIAKYERHKEYHREQGHGFGWKPLDPERERARSLSTKSDRASSSNFVIEPKSKGQGEPDQERETEVVGDLHEDGRLEQHNRVYGTEGTAPTMFTPHGGDKSPKIEVVGELGCNFDQTARVYDTNGLAPAMKSRDWKDATKIEVTPITEKVRVRRYEVDTEALTGLLRDAKKRAGLTNRDIAESLGRPVTEVEHWFRTDSCGSIPDPDIWSGLKTILGIDTDVFDAPICEFVEQDSVYEQGQRCYSSESVAPTLTIRSAPKIEVTGTLGKDTQHYTVYGRGGGRSDLERV